MTGRFAAQRTINGAEVIDTITGRPVAERPTMQAAGYVVAQLVSAGPNWPQVLVRLRASYHAQDSAALIGNPSDPSGVEQISDPRFHSDPSIEAADSFWDPELSLLDSES